MLYTLSQSVYDPDELQSLLARVTENDAVVLWQNGVLQGVKFPELFANLVNVFVLENDVKARGVKIDLPQISLAEFVQISERFYPQVAW